MQAIIFKTTYNENITRCFMQKQFEFYELLNIIFRLKINKYNNKQPILHVTEIHIPKRLDSILPSLFQKSKN
jgi:hypothetical protein